MTAVDSDIMLELLIKWLNEGRACELLEGIPADVRPLWERRHEGPFGIADEAEALYSKASDPRAVAATVLESVEAALLDIEEHGQYAEYHDDEEDLRSIAAQWKTRALQPPGPNRPSAAEVEALIEERDDGVLAMSFPRAASPSLAQEEQRLNLERNLETLLRSLTSARGLSPLLAEIAAARVSTRVRAIAANRAESEFEVAHQLIAAFADFCDAHAFPSFFGQEVVSSAARLVSESLDSTSDTIVLQRLVPRTQPAKALSLNLAKLHARMNRRAQMIDAIRVARLFGARRMDFPWQFNPYLDDPEVAALIKAD